MTLTVAHQTNSTTGDAASGTSTTVTLPTYDADSYLVLIFGGGQNMTAHVFGENVTATALTGAEATGAAGRLKAWRIVPDDLEQTDFSLSWTTTAFYRWVMLDLAGFYADTGGAYKASGENIGSNTTAAIACPAITSLPKTTVGDELCVSAALVNATATWSDPSDDVYTSTSGNSGMQVRVAAVGSGLTSVTPAAFDRGLGGTTRNESAIGIVFFPGTEPSSESNVFDASGNPLSIFDASGNPVTVIP